MSSDESYSIDNESDGIGYGSVSSGTYSFCNSSLRFEDSVGSGSVLGSAVFAPTGFKSKGDIFASGMSVPIGVDYKGVQLIKMFWRSNSLFYFQI